MSKLEEMSCYLGYPLGVDEGGNVVPDPFDPSRSVYRGQCSTDFESRTIPATTRTRQAREDSTGLELSIAERNKALKGALDLYAKGRRASGHNRSQNPDGTVEYLDGVRRVARINARVAKLAAQACEVCPFAKTCEWSGELPRHIGPENYKQLRTAITPTQKGNNREGYDRSCPAILGVPCTDPQKPSPRSVA